MKKVIIIVCLLLFTTTVTTEGRDLYSDIVFEIAKSCQVIEIKIRDDYAFILTTCGESRVHMYQALAIKFDNNIDWPILNFDIDTTTKYFYWGKNDHRTLIFKDPKQAKEWMGYDRYK